MKLLKEQPMMISKGLVFDIKRFAIHDGKGIRTTVFLKGCPLRCKWCQNPEGLLIKKQPIFLKRLCIGCKLCKENALENQIIYKDRPYFNLSYQGDFDNLVKVCPTNAIQYDSLEYSVDELLKEIKSDLVFFQEEGGVTFSGGEPFSQFEFLLEILKVCKESNIDTAIETTCYTSLDNLKAVLPYLDTIYCDLKFFKDEKHIEGTRVSNKLVLDNIKYLLKSEYKDKVIIRTPLIPSQTGDKENIREIASYISSLYPDIRYELLNYNPLASSKYDLTQFKYGIDKKYKAYTKSQMNEFYEVAIQAGIKNLIIE